MRVLLAVDGSAFSDYAIDEVARRPWPAGSEIKVITAVEMPMMVGIEPWAASPDYFEQLEKAIRSAAQDVITRALSKLSTRADKEINVNTIIVEGSPRQVIVDEAEKWKADLIVLGSRGLGAWNRLLLGSVSSAVVHHAKCSVEIVRKAQA